MVGFGSRADGLTFDRVVAVDWSAAAAPKTGADSIWIAERGSSGATEVLNTPTRATAAAHLDVLVRRSADAGGRVLIAIDASLGYPSGTAAALGLDGPPWQAMWQLLAELVTDDDRNRNNRFEAAAGLNARTGDTPGPFWGVPAQRASAQLTTRKVSPEPLAEWRVVEQLLRTLGFRPFSAWQLLGAGSVGSQTLTAVPVLQRLRSAWASDGLCVDVWPFTTGFAAPNDTDTRADAVIVEAWPSLFEMPTAEAEDAHPVKDARQVTELVARLCALDERGELRSLFVPDAVSELTATEQAAALTEEGWVFGVS